MIEPLQVAVCEDTKSDEEKLLTLLQECDIPSAPTVFPSGEALLEHYTPRTYDLILSDIYMGGITGVETITRIRELDPDIPVAFITTSTDFALEGYRLNVLKYIEKPFQAKDIHDILKLAKMERDTAPALHIPINGRDTRVRFTQVVYLEQQTHHINVYLKDGSALQVCEKLSELVPELDRQGFIQPHKSFAVNLDYVTAIDPELRCFVMVGGENVPIRRELMSKARKLLKEHLFERARGGLS